MKKFITNKDLLQAFKNVGLTPKMKSGEWLNIARPDGMHCEFYPNSDDNYAFCATYTIDNKDCDLDFYLPADLDLFVKTVCKILEHKGLEKYSI